MKALGGDKKALGAAAALGISPGQLSAMGRADLYMGPLAAAARTRSQESLATPFGEIFGAGRGQLGAAIKILQTDFEELHDKMKGTMMDAKTAAGIKLLSDTMDLLSGSILNTLAPAIETTGEFLLWLAGKLKSYYTFLTEGYKASPASKVPLRLPSETGLSGWFHANFLRAPIYSKEDQKKTWTGASDAATKGAAAVEKENAEKMADFELRQAALVGRLNTPPAEPPPGPEEEEKTAAGRKSHTAHLPKEDALIRIGNFLGSSAGGIGGHELRKVSLLQQIANNTAFHKGYARDYGLPRSSHDLGDTVFPI
jgi:hypothetical protein